MDKAIGSLEGAAQVNYRRLRVATAPESRLARIHISHCLV